ncbi:hypothetical protein MPER_07356, partial [Moniliophthora perniciosa FA553]
CQDVQLTWEATKGPYNIPVVPANDPCEGDVLADLGDTDATSVTWKPDLPAGWQVILSALDGNDEEAWSGTITIGGGDSSCVRAEFAPASSGQGSTSNDTLVVPPVKASPSPYSVSPLTANEPTTKGSTTNEPTAKGPLGGVASDPLTSGALSQTTTPMLILGAVSAIITFAL